MFQPKVRHIVYTIRKPSGETVRIPVQLDQSGLADGRQGSHPPDGDCSECERCHGGCKAEAALSTVIDSFDDLQSTDEVEAEVIIEGRVTSLRSPAPRVLASAMGLLMASSGCSRLAPFQAMALFHQPFATAEENVVRAAGFWLMGCWARGETLNEDSFRALQSIWDGLEEVNRHLAGKILARCSSDAASNGIAFLDALAKIGTAGLESAIDMLRPVLAASMPPANSQPS